MPRPGMQRTGGDACGSYSRRALLAVAAGGLVAAWAPAVEASAGKRIAKIALRYKGSRYVSGGNTPRGFDCSGFTQFVVRKAIGIDIGQTVKGQWRTGKRVDRGRWETGDLVFFENTFEKGLSHVGIYLDHNRFIHAENERTGVVISQIDSDYYSDHYRGARRLR